MRKYVLLTILFFMFNCLAPADCLAPAVEQAEKMQTLISGPIHHGFYLAPVTKMSRMDGKTAFLAGAKMAWLINHRFAIGFAGYGRIDNVEWDCFHNGAQTTEHMGYGGLLLEANVFPLKVLHLNAGLLLGGGAVIRPDDRDAVLIGHGSRECGRYRYQTDVFLAVEPELNLEINVTRFFALGVGVAYRFVSGIDKAQGSSNENMSGLSSALTMKFGRL
jgi:hypothetical protein